MSDDFEYPPSVHSIEYDSDGIYGEECTIRIVKPVSAEDLPRVAARVGGMDVEFKRAVMHWLMGKEVEELRSEKQEDDDRVWRKASTSDEPEAEKSDRREVEDE